MYDNIGGSFDDDPTHGEILDTYEKRDRLSQYKKMNIRSSQEDEEESEDQQLTNGNSPGKGGANSAIANMKLSKAGIPLGRHK